ncbi:hypothetical protein DRJ24_06180, partial [Candidatus Acetothermia bacterium]
MEGRIGMQAPCAIAPSMTLSIRSPLTNGRAPSWMRTISPLAASTPARAESRLSSPPGTIRTGGVPLERTDRASSYSPGRTTMTISSILSERR